MTTGVLEELSEVCSDPENYTHYLMDDAMLQGMDANEWLQRYADRIIFTREQILENASEEWDAPVQSGLYFHVDQGEIVYIGLAQSLNRRMNNHYQAKRYGRGHWFERVFMIRPMWPLEELESYYIQKFMPPGNRDMKRKPALWDFLESVYNAK